LFQNLKNILSFVDEPLLVRTIGSPSKANFASLQESDNLNDHVEEEHFGSGINPRPEPDNGAVEEMVHAVRERDTFFFLVRNLLSLWPMAAAAKPSPPCVLSVKL